MSAKKNGAIRVLEQRLWALRSVADRAAEDIAARLRDVKSAESRRDDAEREIAEIEAAIVKLGGDVPAAPPPPPPSIAWVQNAPLHRTGVNAGNE